MTEDVAGVRTAVRIVLVDPSERVLLLWHEAPHDDPHWAPPGGGVEPGETPEQAARRELAEEVGLAGVALEPPRWRWRHTFSFAGAPVTQEELIYLVRVEPFDVAGPRGEHEADGIVQSRWWSITELGAGADVWPPRLVDLVSTPVGAPAPAEPLDLAGA